MHLQIFRPAQLVVLAVESKTGFGLGTFIEHQTKIIATLVDHSKLHSKNKCCYFNMKINTFWLHFSNMFKRLYSLNKHVEVFM